MDTWQSARPRATRRWGLQFEYIVGNWNIECALSLVLLLSPED